MSAYLKLYYLKFLTLQEKGYLHGALKEIISNQHHESNGRMILNNNKGDGSCNYTGKENSKMAVLHARTQTANRNGAKYCSLLRSIEFDILSNLLINVFLQEFPKETSQCLAYPNQLWYQQFSNTTLHPKLIIKHFYPNLLLIRWEISEFLGQSTHALCVWGHYYSSSLSLLGFNLSAV